MKTTLFIFIRLSLVALGLSVVIAACSGGGGNSSSRDGSPIQGQASFLALPFSNTTVSKCAANGISDDGSIVVGQCADEQGEFEPVMWVNGQVDRLGFMTNSPGVPKNAYAYGVSNGGIVIGGEGYENLSPLGYYYSNGQWLDITNPATSLDVTAATGISSDGSVIVGYDASLVKGGTGAYYFQPSNGTFYMLPSVFSVEYNCSAAGVSCINAFSAVDAEGKTAVGYDSISSTNGSIPAQSRPLLYKIATNQAPVLLPLPDSYEMGTVQTISRDGSFMAGGTSDLWMPVEAVYWDNDYEVHTIGSLGPDTVNRDTMAYGISDSGVAVGQSNNQAFVFDDKNGLRALADYLTTLGLGSQIQGWQFLRASAITHDGSYIAGTGVNGSGQLQGFLVHVSQ